MRRYALLVLLSVPVAAASLTTTGRGVALTVGDDGSLQVKHTATGRIWRTAPVPPPPTLAIRQAAQPPRIDGDLSDWTGVPTVSVATFMTGEVPAGGGAADCSATAAFQWDAAGLYVALRVRDDRVVFPTAPDLRWWDKDSAEVWVGGTQIGFSLTSQGVIASLVSRPAEGVQVALGPFAGDLSGQRDQSRVCFQPVAFTPDPTGGYGLEVAVPWALRTGGALRLGEQLPLAVGINDADATGLRESQVYWPATWRHSQTDTFALATLADVTGRLPGPAPRPTPAVSGLRRLANGFAMRRAVPLPGGQSVAADLTITTVKDAAAVELTINLPDPTVPFQSTAFPAPLSADLPAGWVCLAPYLDGLALPQDNERYANRAFGPALDLPFIGVWDQAKGDGYLLLLETPHDGQLRLTQVTGADGRKRLVPQAVWLPIKGQFGAARKLRLEFVERGGYVAIAKRYRAYAQRQGLVQTLREKRRARPHVDRLAGAPDVWAGDLSWAQEAAARGMEHCLLNYTAEKSRMQQAVDLGFLTSRYDNYADLLEEKDETKWTNSRGSLDDVIVKANGELEKGWLTWDKKTQYYERSSTTAVAAAKRYIPGDLESHAYLGRFLDVTTASGYYEDYHPTRGQDRRTDVANRIALGQYVNDLGLVTGGEHGRFWAVPVFDYFEGMQSGNSFFSWPAGHLRKPVNAQDEPSIEGISADYRTYGIGPLHRVPLWSLVFHDCVVSYWYWGDSTDFLHSLDPSITDRKDAINVLYGTPPMYWVNGTGFGRSEAGWRRLMESYWNTCRWHAAVMYEELLNHEPVTPDKQVQKTTFSGGHEAIVNFAAEPRTVKVAGQDVTLPPDGFTARGPGILVEKRILDGRTVTRIQSKSYAYVDGGGKLASVDGLATAGRCAVRILGPDRLQVVGYRDAATINPSALVPGWDIAGTRLFSVDAAGGRVAALDLPAGQRIAVAAGQEPLEIATGAQTKAADLALGAISVAPASLVQGQPLVVSAEVRNDGGTAVRGGRVAVSLDGGEPLTTVAVNLGARAKQTLKLAVPTAGYDGPRRLAVTATPPAGVTETLTANNRATRDVVIALDRARWPAQAIATLAVTPGAAGPYQVLAVPFTLPADAAPASLRVVATERAGASLPAQFEPAAPGGREGTLVVLLQPAPTAATRLEVLAQTGSATVAPLGGGYWSAVDREYDNGFYAVSLTDGVLADLRLRTGAPGARAIITGVAYSSAITGWTQEQGRTEAFDVLASGPARTVVRIKRNLADGKAVYTKTYAFYPAHIEVVTAAQPTVTSLHNRFHYGREADYFDSRGKTTRIDGKGDDDAKISGAPATWCALVGDDWAHSIVSLDQPRGVTFWDAGAMGALGLSATPEASHQAFVFHANPAGARLTDGAFAAADEQWLKNPAKVTAVP